MLKERRQFYKYMSESISKFLENCSPWFTASSLLLRTYLVRTKLAKYLEMVGVS